MRVIQTAIGQILIGMTLSVALIGSGFAAGFIAKGKVDETVKTVNNAINPTSWISEIIKK